MWQAIKFTENMLESIDKSANEFAGNENSESNIMIEDADDEDMVLSPSSIHVAENQPSSENETSGTMDREKDELQRQINNLIEEKLSITNKFTKSLEEKEEDFNRILKNLQFKDEFIAKIQHEKDEQNKNLQEFRNSKLEEIKELKSEILKKGMENDELSEELTKMKITSDGETEDLRESKEEMERNYVLQVEKLKEKEEEISMVKKILDLKNEEMVKKEEESGKYKEKVQQIVKMKNEKIENLEKENEGETVSQEIEEERRRSNEKVHFEIESLRNEIKELNLKDMTQKKYFESEISSLRLKIRHMEKNIENKEEDIFQSQEIISNLKMKFNSANILSERKMSSLKNQLMNKENEINELKFQIEKEKNENPTKQKLKKLTEHLIRKQSTIETLESEKLAMKLKLEKSGLKLKEYQDSRKNKEGQKMFLNQGNSLYNRRKKTEDTIIEIPMSSRRFKSQRKMNVVKKGMYFLDNYSIYFQTLLSSNQSRRVGFIIYAVLIHLILLIVIYSR